MTEPNGQETTQENEGAAPTVEEFEQIISDQPTADSNDEDEFEDEEDLELDDEDEEDYDDK